jgi:hypothetical protein
MQVPRPALTGGSALRINWIGEQTYWKPLSFVAICELYWDLP